MDAAELKKLIGRAAGKLGFARVGVAAARPAAHAGRFRRFLELGYHADMAWLARAPDRRADPRNLLDGAASVICLAVSCAPAPGEAAPERIARYARGRDYHRVLKARCRRLVDEIDRAAGGVRARICVDSSPLPERELAASAGLGWIGRNGCLIDRELGSHLLLAEIVTDLHLPTGGQAGLPADEPVPNRCGSCRACVEACPTGAIREDALIDARRCVSYLTIEHRRSVPEGLRRGVGGQVFGCDVCQQVCPFNRRAPAGDAELRGPTELVRTELPEMLVWTRADWDRLTRGTAARRATAEMFLRNAALAAGNAREARARPALERLAAGGPPAVAEAAAWALERLRDV